MPLDKYGICGIMCVDIKEQSLLVLLAICLLA